MNKNSRYGHEFTTKYVHEIKEYHRQIFRDEVMKRSEQKNLNSYIQRMVNLAKTARNEDVEAKRDRLRTLLQMEELQYQSEYIEKNRNRSEISVREKEESFLALQKESEKKRDDFVKQKRLQQFMSNCDEIRPFLRKNLLKESKICQLAQIEEKRQMQLKDKEVEALWLKVRQCIEEAEKQKIRDEQCQRHIRNKEDKMQLDKQIQAIKEAREKEKQEAYEERMALEAEIRSEADKERRLKEKGLAKREVNRKEIRSALEEGMRLRKLREQNELYYEKLYSDAVKIQIAKENEELKAKVNTLKEATLRYLVYCNEIKKKKEQEENELNEVLMSYRRRTDEETVRKWQQELAKRADKAKQCHEELLKQIRQNAERNLQEQHEEYYRAVKDHRRVENEMRLEKEKEIKKNQAALAYGKDLLNQIEDIKRNQQEQRKQFLEDLQKASAEEDFRLRLAEKFIQQDTDYLPAHPNWKLMTCPCLQN